MFYAFCHNWSIVLCETKSKLFPARIPNYQAVFRKVWILYKFGFVGNVYPQPELACFIGSYSNTQDIFIAFCRNIIPSTM